MAHLPRRQVRWLLTCQVFSLLQIPGSLRLALVRSRSVRAWMLRGIPIFVFTLSMPGIQFPAPIFTWMMLRLPVVLFLLRLRSPKHFHQIRLRSTVLRHSHLHLQIPIQSHWQARPSPIRCHQDFKLQPPLQPAQPVEGVLPGPLLRARQPLPSARPRAAQFPRAVPARSSSISRGQPRDPTRMWAGLSLLQTAAWIQVPPAARPHPSLFSSHRVSRSCFLPILFSPVGPLHWLLLSQIQTRIMRSQA